MEQIIVLGVSSLESRTRLDWSFFDNDERFVFAKKNHKEGRRTFGLKPFRCFCFSFPVIVINSAP